MTFLIEKIAELQPEKSDQKAFALGPGEPKQDSGGDRDHDTKVELKSAEPAPGCCFRS